MKVFDFIIIFALVILINAFIIFLSKELDLFITDHLHKGPQKFHENPTPRIGGLGIFVALSIGLLVYNPKFWIDTVESLFFLDL